MCELPPVRTVGASLLALSLAVFVLALGTGQQPAAPASPAGQAATAVALQPSEPPALATAMPATTPSAEPVLAAAGEPHEAAADPTVDDDNAPAVVSPASPVEALAAPRVGIQAGHWLSEELPDELARLRTSTGTSGGGVPEWRLNLDIARRVAALLEAQGVVVDVLPSTIPPGYTADAFVALHADGDSSGTMSGFKMAASRWTGDPRAEQQLLAAVAMAYGEATGLGTDSHVSRNMTGYYAFSNRRLQHAVAPLTPAIILEMGFMTNASDLEVLLGAPDSVAQGIARGVLAFLEAKHAPATP